MLDRSFKALRSGRNVGVPTAYEQNAGFLIMVVTKTSSTCDVLVTNYIIWIKSLTYKYELNAHELVFRFRGDHPLNSVNNGKVKTISYVL